MALRGFVCYCPDLRLYRYKVENDEKPDQDVDYKFDEDELENAIAAHIASENHAEADFMAKLTGLARVNPHKFVHFDQGTEEIKSVDPAEYWKVHDEARDREEVT